MPNLLCRCMAWGLVGATGTFTACFNPEEPDLETASSEATMTASTMGVSQDVGTSTSTSAETTGTASSTSWSNTDSGALASSEESTATSAAESDSGSTGSATSSSSSEASTASPEDSTSATAGPHECDCTAYEVCFVDTCVEAHVVYLNFDAEGEMVYDPGEIQDATLNRHNINRNFVGELAGYGRGAKRGEVLEAVRKQFESYGVVITDTRPEGVPYSMIVFTPPPAFDSDNIEAGEPDCGNATPNSVHFVYLTADDASPAAYHANLVGRAIAMGIGLEPVTVEAETYDVMSASLASDERWFHNECHPIAAEPPLCPEQHAHFCEDGTQQAAHHELEVVFGWLGNYYDSE